MRASGVTTENLRPAPGITSKNASPFSRDSDGGAAARMRSSVRGRSVARVPSGSVKRAGLSEARSADASSHSAVLEIFLQAVPSWSSSAPSTFASVNTVRRGFVSGSAGAGRGGSTGAGGVFSGSTGFGAGTGAGEGTGRAGSIGTGIGSGVLGAGGGGGTGSRTVSIGGGAGTATISRGAGAGAGVSRVARSTVRRMAAAAAANPMAQRQAGAFVGCFGMRATMR